jgi:hypothetical protein
VKFRRHGTCEVQESETGEVQETWNLRSSGVWKLAKFRRPGTYEIREFEGASIRELQ